MSQRKQPPKSATVSIDDGHGLEITVKVAERLLRESPHLTADRAGMLAYAMVALEGARHLGDDNPAAISGRPPKRATRNGAPAARSGAARDSA